MEKSNTKQEQPEIYAKSVEKAVEKFINKNDQQGAIDFLRKNPDEITEFSLQVTEKFKPGDKTGIILLAKIIKELIK